MRFLDFKQHFEVFRVFSVRDIMKWDPGFDTRRLVEWQNKKYIRRIVNRWYMFAGENTDENFLYVVANRIHAPSYVSFESALSYYNLIPEHAYTVTSATSLKTRQVSTFLGTFSYRHLKPALVFGYRLVESDGRRYLMAEPEKVILDYLYLNSGLRTGDDFESLRINQAELHALVRKQKIEAYLKLFGNKALQKRTGAFLKMYLPTTGLAMADDNVER